jgi:hypothetical protein
MMVLIGVVLGLVLERVVRQVVFPPPVLAPGPLPEPLPAHTSTPPPAAGEMPDSLPGDGSQTVPDGYPIKGNERSGIYHLPGGFAYDRTIASVYFRTEEAAERAGYRRAKV